jgi:sensor histidine kinase YesM
MLALLLTNLSFAVLLGWILANKERSEEREAEAVQAATLAKARALQSQMSPHVLFNAISGLTELVWKDQKATEEALVNLAQLLRNLLDSSTRPVDPLASERTLVEHYLAVERIRLGARLRVEWDWDEQLESHLVPPLMLQPLVENAIKHGIATSRDGGDLRIFLRAEGSGLCFGVANTGSPFEEGRPEGIGLRNLRERLSLLGQPPECLTLRRKDSWTVAELRLGMNPEAAS